jgi:hypothetical protein
LKVRAGAQDSLAMADNAPTGSTIDGVIARMREIEAGLPRKDGVAYFNRLYLKVTEAVGKASANTTFADPPFLDRLDVVFAGLYFDAEQTIVTGAPCPIAWRPLMQERSQSHSPIQFALAGMNAHINHDLALAVVSTCQERGTAPADDTPQHADYERVNGILQSVEQKVAGWFKDGVIADLEDVVPQEVDNAVAMWSIVAARGLAWDHAKVIWSLRGTPELERLYVDTLARTTELSGLAMLV